MDNANNLARCLSVNTNLSDNTRISLRNISDNNERLYDKITKQTEKLHAVVKAAAAANRNNEKERKLNRQSKKILSKQNQTVEDIVNDALLRIPKNIAGIIRNKIAKSPNKIIALKNELNNYNINM